MIICQRRNMDISNSHQIPEPQQKDEAEQAIFITKVNRWGYAFVGRKFRGLSVKVIVNHAVLERARCKHE